MSTMNLPLEIYDILERKLGRDDAMPVAKAIGVAFGRIEERSYELANQRKPGVKEYLKVELRDELAKLCNEEMKMLYDNLKKIIG